MKKALSVLLSVLMLVTVFVPALGVFAEGEALLPDDTLILIPENATTQEAAAADRLRDLIADISGVTHEVVTDNPDGAYEIAVGSLGKTDADLSAKPEELGGQTLGEALLTPTRIYVKPVLALLEAADVKGISHITGGGFYENIPRAVPDGLCARVDRSAVKIPAIFELLQKTGNIPERDMFNTYNMGVGMAVIVAAADADKALEVLKANGEDAYVIGEIVSGEDKIIIE